MRIIEEIDFQDRSTLLKGSICYCITLHDEFYEYGRLIYSIKPYLRDCDHIFTLWDVKDFDETYSDYERVASNMFGDIKNMTIYKNSSFNRDFSYWKNLLNDAASSVSRSEVFFNLDADEYPTKNMLEWIRLFMDMRDDAGNLITDAIKVPRCNIVDGINEQHLSKWGWAKDQHQRINWPDYQTRIYVNSPKIKWVGSVHEQLTGYKSWASIEANYDFNSQPMLMHVKNIHKQIKQNNLYEQINNSI